MFRRVLVGVDGRSGGRDAIALASVLAAPGAVITLAHVYGPDLVVGGSASLAVVSGREQAEALLEQERNRASFDAQLLVFPGHHVGRGLHALAERVRADLLVVGATERGPLGRVLLGDDTRASLSGAACAVAIASRGYRHPPHKVETLGIGYDSSPPSKLALAAARELAAQHDATVLLHELADDADGDAVYGGLREELVRFGEHLDLLLIGSPGHGPLGRLLRGHVSDYLARRAPCPLVIMPQADRREPLAVSSDEFDQAAVE